MRIGELSYAVGANRLVAQSVTLIATNKTLKTGRVSLAGCPALGRRWDAGRLGQVREISRVISRERIASDMDPRSGAAGAGRC